MSVTKDWLKPPAGKEIWELGLPENKALLKKFWEDSMMENLVVIDEQSEERLKKFVAAVHNSCDEKSGKNLMTLMCSAQPFDSDHVTKFAGCGLQSKVSKICNPALRNRIWLIVQYTSQSIECVI